MSISSPTPNIWHWKAFKRTRDIKKLFSEWETLAKSFRTRHGRNRLLMDEMNRLEDAHGAVLFLESDFLFFLGLQMGLDLGRIDLFRDGWQR